MSSKTLTKAFTPQDLEYITKFLSGNGVPEKTVNLVKILLTNRRIPSTFFVDEYHWLYYLRYVKPKLVRLKAIAVSKNGEYIIVDVDIGKKYENWHTYLIGFDSQQGKLFVNHVFDLPSPYAIDVVDINGIRILVVEESVVKDVVLGYGIDLDRNEYDVIDASWFGKRRDVAFRVQGDVVLYVRMVDDIRKRYVDDIEWHAGSQLSDLLWLYTCNLIARKLREYRIAARIVRQNRLAVITIPSVVPRKAEKDRVERYLKAVANIVREALQVLDPKGELRVECRDYGACFVMIDSYKPIRVVKAAGGEWGNPYVDIFVEQCMWYYDTIVRFSVLRKVLGYVVNQINEFAKQAEPRVYTHRVGDHVIQIPSLPRRIAIPIPDEYFDAELQNTTIMVSLERYYVPRGSEIVLYHSQHGRKVVRLDVDADIEIGTTGVHDMHSAEMTRVALQLLVKKLGI